jgi:hypothetical protein
LSDACTGASSGGVNANVIPYARQLSLDMSKQHIEECVRTSWNAETTPDYRASTT